MRRSANCRKYWSSLWIEVTLQITWIVWEGICARGECQACRPLRQSFHLKAQRLLQCWAYQWGQPSPCLDTWMRRTLHTSRWCAGILACWKHQLLKDCVWQYLVLTFLNVFCSWAHFGVLHKFQASYPCGVGIYNIAFTRVLRESWN